MKKQALTTFMLLLMGVAGIKAQNGPMSVKASIDSIEIMIGSQAHYSITVQTDKSARVELPKLEPRTYISDKVEIIDRVAADTVTDKSGRTITHTWAVTSFEEGLYPLPPQQVKINGQAFQTEPLALKVITLEVDTLHPENFYPPKDVQNNPFMWQEWLPMLWTFIAQQVLVALLFLVLWLIRNRRRLHFNLRPKKLLLPHEKALAGINLLQQEKDAPGKAYYTRLTDSMRLYIAERFGINALEMTSSEIIAGLYAKGQKHLLGELQLLLEAADLAKFAKHEPTPEQRETHMDTAVRYIEESKYIPTPEEMKVMKEKLNGKQTTGERRLLKVVAVVLVLLILATITYLIHFPIEILS